ncbi:MAG: PKD domain-containing protein [Deltaproteobacteria bacterium]|nr:PKD domain-containing protein [Deltaproteobacteria bacterium]
MPDTADAFKDSVSDSDTLSFDTNSTGSDSTAADTATRPVDVVSTDSIGDTSMNAADTNTSADTASVATSPTGTDSATANNSTSGTDSPGENDSSVDTQTDTWSDSASSVPEDTVTETALNCNGAVALDVVSSREVDVQLVESSFSYHVLFNNPVEGFDIGNITWVQGSGIGTIDGVTEINPFEYRIDVTGVAKNDSYTLVIDSSVSDTCGTTLDRAVSVHFLLSDCIDPLPGRPKVVSPQGVYPRGTVSGTYRLVFNEAVQGIDMYSLDLVSDTGTGVMDSVTQIDAKTYDVQFSGVADSDRYSLEVFDTVSDICGNTVASKIEVPIAIWGEYFHVDFDDYDTASSLAGQHGWAPAGDAGTAGWLVRESVPWVHQRTGPEVDHTSGAGNYAIALNSASGSTLGGVQTVEIDLTDAISPQLSFWYFMYGHYEYADMGALRVLVDNGTDEYSLWYMEGEQQTAGSDPWRNVLLDLSSHAGERVRIVFRASEPDSYAGMAIDDVWVREPIRSVVDFIADTRAPGSAQPVHFTDISSDAPDSWLWEFDGPGAPVFEEGTDETSQHPVVRFPVPGSYDVTLTVTNAEGESSVARTAWLAVKNAYLHQDFDNFTNTDIAGQEAWTMYRFDYEDKPAGEEISWWTARETVPSSVPPSDHSGNGNYLAPAPDSYYGTPMAESPEVNLADAVSPLLSFWYYIRGNSGITLRVRVMQESTWLAEVFTITADYTETATDEWIQVYADLSAFVGQTIRIGFDGGARTGFAVDDVIIREPDTMTADFSTPDTSVDLAQVVPFYDETTEVAQTWQWSVSGPGTARFVGGTDSTSRNPLAVFTAAGEYDVTLTVTNDAGTDTHTKSGYITVSDVLYREGFEEFAEGDLLQFGWNVEQNDASFTRWLLVDEAGELPNGAMTEDDSTGGTRYACGYQRYYSSIDGRTASMTGPPLDLSQLAAPVVEFSYFYFGASGSRLWLNVIDAVTGVETEYVAYLYDYTESGPEGAWHRRSVDLSPFAGQVVFLRFELEPDSSTDNRQCPFGVDEISLREMDAPFADFSVFFEDVAVGERILMEDFSTELIQSWDWQISGPGTVSWLDDTDGSSQAPMFALDTPGEYSITLTVTSAAGNDVKTISDYVHVSQTYFLETFDEFAGVPDGNFGWTSDPTVSYADIRWMTGSLSYTEKQEASLHSVAPFERFVETTTYGSQIADKAVLTSPGIDLAGATAPVLDFWVHRSGAEVGDMEVEVLIDGVATLLDTFSGPLATDIIGPWERQVIDLSPYAGNVIQIRWRCHRNGSGSTAIEHVTVHEP